MTVIVGAAGDERLIAAKTTKETLWGEALSKGTLTRHNKLAVRHMTACYCYVALFARETNGNSSLGYMNMDFVGVR